MSPSETQVLALITQSGERLFHGSTNQEVADFYSDLALRSEEFPIIVGIFNNIQDYWAWKSGKIVDCKITILYHYPGTEGLDQLAEACNLSYSGVRAFASVA